MLEPPPIAATTILATLRSHFGLAIAELSFMPLGNDAATWVYRGRGDEGRSYFVKLRKRGGFSAASLEVPRYLQKQGLAHILAPLATRERALWVPLDQFVLTVYPFVEGQMGARVGLTLGQWCAWGALLRQIHDCRLPVELQRMVPGNAFVPSRRSLMPQLDALTLQMTYDNAERQTFAAFWRKKRDLIHHLVSRADSLGRRLRDAGLPPVLCHADMHPWNILVQGDGTWWLVDWDEVVLAPKECDLMFVVGGIGGDGVGEAQTAAFLAGYGHGAIDQLALAYYRYAWAVEDIAAYGEEVFLARHTGAVSRQAAVNGFMSLFDEGNIVSLALGSDTGAA